MNNKILFNSRTPTYAWLSNFHVCPIIYDGITYPSVENFYQAQKTPDRELQLEFVGITAGQAKIKGSELKDIVPEWNTHKINVMLTGINLKYSIPELKQLLINTNNDELVHLSPWDKFWGVDNNGIGSNHLGLMLMNYRNNINMRSMF